MWVRDFFNSVGAVSGDAIDQAGQNSSEGGSRVQIGKSSDISLATIARSFDPALQGRVVRHAFVVGVLGGDNGADISRGGVPKGEKIAGHGIQVPLDSIRMAGRVPGEIIHVQTQRLQSSMGIVREKGSSFRVGIHQAEKIRAVRDGRRRTYGPIEEQKLIETNQVTRLPAEQLMDRM
jgi:hypothetical protein